MNRMDEMQQSPMYVALLILEQLGGIGFVNATGVGQFKAISTPPVGLRFSLDRLCQAKEGINQVEIRLIDTGRYDMLFQKRNEDTAETLHIEKNVEAEKLRFIFEKLTGLGSR